MPNPNVGFRLSTDGKATVVQDFADVKRAGVDAATSIADANEQGAARSAAANDQYTEREMAAFRKRAAAAKAAWVDQQNQAANRSFFGQDTNLGTGAAEDAAAAFMKVNNAIGLNRSQMQEAQSAVIRFTDSILAGASPLRAFALEAHKGVEVLASDDDGLAGGLAKVRAAFSPMNLAIGAGTAVIIAAAAAGVHYVDVLNQLDRAATGYGRTSELTGQQLEAFAAAGADAGNVSVGAARDTEEAILHQTRSTGPALEEAVAISQRLADAMGVDLKDANKELATAMADPAKAADVMSDKFGYLTAAQRDHIHELMDQNDLYGAQQSLLGDLNQALDRSGDHVNAFTKLWRGLSAAMSQGIENIGRGVADLAGVGPVVDQIDQKENQVKSLILQDAGRHIPQLQSQIRDLETEIGKLGAQANQVDQSARRNQLAQQARSIAGNFTGEPHLEELRRNQAVLQQAVSGNVFGGDAAANKDATEALDAYTQAVKSYLPPAEQHLAIRKAQAEMARATTKAERDLAGQHLEEAQNAGKVATTAERAADAMARGERAADRFKHTGDAHAATLAREAAAMEANATGALAVADAYEKGSAAGMIAEAQRKAMTDATKKGIDVDAEVRRQLNLNIAEADANASKSIAQLTDETAARAKINAAVGDGTIVYGKMNEQLSDEATLRPLVTAQAVAQQLGLTKLYDDLTRRVDAYKAALAAAHAEEQRGAMLQARHANDNQIAGMADQRAFAGDASQAAAAEMARRAALRDVADKFPDLNASKPEDEAKIASYVASMVAVAKDKWNTDTATFFAQTKRSQTDSMELDQAEIALVGATAEKHDLIINHLKEEQALKARGVDLSSDEAKADLARVDALSHVVASEQKVQAAQAELRSAGDQFLDDVLNPQNWTSFGDMATKVLNDIEQEMIKLAVLNPLKNMLFGESNATLGSVFSLFGGGGFNPNGAGTNVSLDTSGIGPLASSLGFATGTDYAPGGLAWVGENGPEMIELPRQPGETKQENDDLSKGGGALWIAQNGKQLVDLPQGSRVTPAAETRRVLYDRSALDRYAAEASSGDAKKPGPWLQPVNLPSQARRVLDRGMAIDHFASGTDYASGGLAWVGEHGKELMNLPQGSRVTPAAETRRMLSAANDSAPHVLVSVQSSEYFDAHVSSISGKQIQAAAPHIAAGGAQLSRFQAAKKRRRSLVAQRA